MFICQIICGIERSFGFQSLRDNGIKTRYMDIPDTDHFNVVEKLKEDTYALTKVGPFCHSRCLVKVAISVC